MSRARTLKVVLFTGYACNNNCLFCIDADKRGLPQKTTAELLRGAADAARRGAGVLEIIGGEATIRPDFARVVAAAKKLGIPRVACATNGRVFADPAAARRIVASGIDSLIFSVHGPDAKTHDALTRAPGSFAQLKKGLANLKALGFTAVNGNTTVVRQNMAALPAYSVPLFLRIVEEVETTVTFKARKQALRDAGFDPSAIADPLYVLVSRNTGYEPLTPALFDHLKSGKLRL